MCPVPGDFGHPRQQLGDAERLGEHGVLPEHLLQAGYGLDLSGDDDDGNIGEGRVAAQLLEHPDPAEVRHHQVEQDQRRPVAACLHQSGETVRRDGDVVALRGQQRLQQTADARVVLDHQDVRRCHRGCPSLELPVTLAVFSCTRVLGIAQDARQRVGEGHRLVVGEHQRRGEPDRVRCDRVDDETGVPRRGLHCGRLAVAERRAQATGRARARRRTASPPAALSASRQVAPSRVTCSSRPSFSMVSSTARAAAQLTGLPPKVEPWSPFCRASAVSPVARQAPIGRPPPSPFASGDDVGNDAFVLVPEPPAGAADAGLDLVEDEQRAGRVAQSARLGEVAVGRRDDAGLAQRRLEEDRGRRCRRPPRRARPRRRRGRT